MPSCGRFSSAFMHLAWEYISSINWSIMNVRQLTAYASRKKNKNGVVKLMHVKYT